MTFDLEKARADTEHLRENIEEEFSCMCGVCHVCGFNPEETLGALAEIERLRADNAALSKAVIDIQEERDLAQAEFRAYHKAWGEQAARIKELDGMLDARSKEIVGRIQECQACQIDQLRAEGKIGPDANPHDHTTEMAELNADHPYPAEAPRSWQITDERKAALSRAYDVISWIDRVDSDNQKHIDVLRVMLEEAERK